ncbi:MAG: hypothetical protein JNL26_09385, partial [Gemmatimonadetes bacterium]|nr:hypothetical protein [Gemmatimonadota bacterium]
MRTIRLPRRWGALGILGALALAACAGGPPPQTAVTEDGIYDFTGSTGEATTLRGSLTILAGSMSLSPEFGTCRVDQAVSSTERSRFLCDNTSDVEQLAFIIDLRFPLTRSSWSGRLRRRQTRTVCARYATQNGRQVCVQTRTETVDVMVPV